MRFLLLIMLLPAQSIDPVEAKCWRDSETLSKQELRVSLAKDCMLAAAIVSGENAEDWALVYINVANAALDAETECGCDSISKAAKEKGLIPTSGLSDKDMSLIKKNSEDVVVMLDDDPAKPGKKKAVLKRKKR